MTLSVDHVSAATGKTVTVTISKNGAAFGAASGAVSEISSGWYSIAGNSGDRDTLGGCAFHCTATGCDVLDFLVPIITIDPFAAQGGILTQPINFTGTGASALVKVDTVDWNGTAVSSPATAGIPDVNLINWRNVQPLALNSNEVQVAPDWSNILNATSTIALTNTTIKNVTGTPPDSAGVTTLLLRIASALSISAGAVTVGSVASGAIAAASFAANALDAVWSTTARTLTAFSFTVNASLTQILGTALTESTPGWLAAAFRKFFNLATPTGTINDLPGVNPGTAGGLPVLDANLGVNANVIDTGTAQGGSLTGITLKAGSSAVDDFYKGQGVRLTTGPGAGQFGSITAYSGTTKLASVVFVTAPTSATTYELLAAGGGSSGGGDPATIAAAVWNSPTASYTLSGSFGALLTSIYNKLSSAVNTFISPVATNMDTTIYADRDFNAADGLALIYPTNITVGVSDTITWNAGPQGSPYASITGYYISANSVGVNITATQGADFPGNSDTTFEVVVTRSGNGRKIQAVTGKLTIDGVIVA